MGRRYYSRRPRIVRPKRKWGSNLVQVMGPRSGTVEVLPSAAASATHHTFNAVLAENKVQAGTPTPVVVKCGNFKVKGDLAVTYESQSATLGACVVYVVFVPEGVSVGWGILDAHPEWILGWTAVDIDGTSGSGQLKPAAAFSLTSRLKRNLNSGDSVHLLIDFAFIPSSAATQAQQVAVTYKPAICAQFWTCAN